MIIEQKPDNNDGNGAHSDINGQEKKLFDLRLSVSFDHQKRSYDHLQQILTKNQNHS